MRSSALYFLAVSLAAAANASAQWTTVNLHPTGMLESKAMDVRLGQEVGYANNNGGPAGGLGSIAARWTHSAASFQNWGNDAGFFSTDGVQQAGVVGLSAAYVQGSPTPVTYLNSAPPGTTLLVSQVNDVFAGEQVGDVYFLNPNNVVNVHATLWTGSAASAIDLNPAGASGSFANGTYIGQEVGWYGNGAGTTHHAVVWYGSAASYVDVNPAGATESQLNDVYNGKQAGYAIVGGVKQAYLWTNTAGSAVSLQPTSPTITASELLGIENGKQVGYATRNGVERAALWTGTAASYVDLAQFLPSGYVASHAEGFWTAPNGDLFVAGWAVNPTTGSPEAFLWTTATLPEPTTLAAMGAAGVLALCRRRRAV